MTDGRLVSTPGRKARPTVKILQSSYRNSLVDQPSVPSTTEANRSIYERLVNVLKVDITIPDFSSISRRSESLPKTLINKAKEPGSVFLIDSTGLKVFGKDEWHQEKHAVDARRT
ncbi:MAG: transposase [Methylococcales bacterium]